jgi:hypothetical protein
MVDHTEGRWYKSSVANLTVDAQELVLRLSPLEKVGALQGDVRVDLSHVKGAWVTATPWSELRGYRAPGTGIPWVIMLGTTRGSFGKDFCAVYGRKPALIVELEAASFKRLLISTTEPQLVAERIMSMRSSAH